MTGGLITAVIGVLMMPWKLMGSMGDYIFTWLIGYSGLMGAIAGILICDYWIIRSNIWTSRHCSIPAEGTRIRRVSTGRRLLVLALAVAPVVPGFLRAATTPGGQVAQPTILDTLYVYAWFVTFTLGFLCIG